VLSHSFFRDCPEHVDLDLGSLIEENKIVTTFAKPRFQTSALAVAASNVPTETVDLTSKPSLLGKRTSLEADLDLTENEQAEEIKKPRLI